MLNCYKEQNNLKIGLFFKNVTTNRVITNASKPQEGGSGGEEEKKEGNFLINVTSSLYPDLTSTQPMKRHKNSS